jgi:PHD/YefM family antitoxin component YafN of YafNO toxin-antitoxin module
MKTTARMPDRTYIVDERGKRVSVVLSVEDYAELMEDLSDLAAIAERRAEPTVDHRRLIDQLKAERLL